MNKTAEINTQVESIEVPRLADKIFEILKDKILSSFYHPGQRLNEAEIAKSLGTSRSPVREALQRLANEGLVKLIPRKGALVNAIELMEIKDDFELREALEIFAARLCSERAQPQQLEEMRKILEKAKAVLQSNQFSTYPWDIDFHKQIFRMAMNPKLEEMGLVLCLRLKLVRSHLGSRKGRARLAMREHEKIFEAILSKSPDKAEKAARQHLRNVFINLTQMMSDQQ